MNKEPKDLYDRDFLAWTTEQVMLLRSGRAAQADLDRIAEEIESMGRAEKRELVDSLFTLLLHLLKWQYQPSKRDTHWTRLIREQRLRVADQIMDSPSLLRDLEEHLARGYELALIAAADETGLAEAAFPTVCPYSFREIIDASFWPAS